MTLEELCLRVENLEKNIKCLAEILKNSIVKVSWEEKITESGIQLQGSSACVVKKGYVFDTQILPTGPNEAKLFFVIKKENGEIGTVPAEACRVEND
jgi:hypothetical protein